MFRKITTALLVALSLTCVAFPEVQAQPVNGPLYRVTCVDAYSTDRYEAVLRGGERVRIVVNGRCHTDLDLYVFDQWGNLVGVDNDNTSYCVVTFTPSCTGKFCIRVKNLGCLSNHYKIEVE